MEHVYKIYITESNNKIKHIVIFLGNLNKEDVNKSLNTKKTYAYALKKFFVYQNHQRLEFF